MKERIPNKYLFLFPNWYKDILIKEEKLYKRIGNVIAPFTDSFSKSLENEISQSLKKINQNDKRSCYSSNG